MKNMYLRVALFTGLKSSAFNLIMLITGFIVAAKMSAMMYSIVFACLFMVMTFVFAEWIFTGVRIKIVPLIGMLILGYVVDTLISIAFFSWYYDRNLFLEQAIQTHLIYGGLYLISMMGAYILKKRMTAMRGGVEGLV